MADTWKPIKTSDTWKPLRTVDVGEAPKRNVITAGLTSGLYDLKGLGISAGAAVADTFGVTGARDKMNEWADDAQADSARNGRPDLEKVEDAWDQGKMLQWAAYQASKQVPMMAGAIGLGLVSGGVGAAPLAMGRAAAMGPRIMGMGGMGARVAATDGSAAAVMGAQKAALRAGQTFSNQIVGGGAFNVATGAGSLYQEAVEGGNPDSGGISLLGALPYALAETLPQAMLVGNVGHGAFKGSLAKRMGKAAATHAPLETSTELFQNEMEMAYNGSVTPEQAASRRLNSAAAGGLVGGVFGSAGGIRSGAPRARVPGAVNDVPDTSTDILAPPQLLLGHDGYFSTSAAERNAGRGGLPTERQTPFVTYPDGSTATSADAALMHENGITEDQFAAIRDTGAPGPAPHQMGQMPPRFDPAMAAQGAEGMAPYLPRKMIADQGGQVALDAQGADALHGEVDGDPGLAEARRRYLEAQGVKREEGEKAAALQAAVQQKKGERDALQARTKHATGIASTKAIDLFGALERQRTAGLIDDDGLANDAALITRGEFPKVASAIKARDAEVLKAQQAAAAPKETQNASAPAPNGAPQAADVGRSPAGTVTRVPGPGVAQPRAGAAAQAPVVGVAPAAVQPGAGADAAALTVVEAPKVDPIASGGAVALAATRLKAKRANVAEIAATLPEAQRQELQVRVQSALAGGASSEITSPKARVHAVTAQVAGEMAAAANAQVQAAAEAAVDRALSPAEQAIITKLATLSPREDAIVRDSLGWDKDNHQVNEPMSLSELGAKHGGVSKEAIRKLLANAGISQRVLDVMHGTELDTSSGEELGLTSTEGGAALGYRITDKQGAGADDFIFESKDAKATRASEAALTAATPEALKGADATLAAKQAEKDSAFEKKRADAAAASRDLVVVPRAAAPQTLAEMLPADMRNDVEDAAADWNEDLLQGSPVFTDLDLELQASWVKTYAARADGKISAQTYARRQEELIDEQNRTSGVDAHAQGVAPGTGRPARIGNARSGDQHALVRVQEGADRPAQAVSPSGQAGVAPRAQAQIAHNNVIENDAQGNPLAKFSKAQASTGGTVDTVLAALAGLMPINRQKVIVVATVKDLPAGVARSVGATANTQAFVIDGKAYLIADQIDPGTERAVFLHEVGAHLGMENLLDAERYDALVDKITAWAGQSRGSLEKRLAIKAMERVHSAGTSDAQANSELVAYFIEEAVNAGVDPTAMKFNSEIARWMREMFAAFKNALAKLGLVDAKGLTAQDIVDLAYGAAKIEMDSAGQTENSEAQRSQSSGALRSWARQAMAMQENTPIAPVLAPTDLMRMLGLYRPVVLDADHVRHMVKNHPEVTPELIADLPQLMKNPRLVSKRADGSYRFVLDAKSGGRVLMVAVQPETVQGTKVFSVRTLFAADTSAKSIMNEVHEGQVLYASQKGVARLRELQSEASIASKPAGASTTTPITERQNIVLSDAALAKFSAGDPTWKTDTVSLGANNAQVNAMGSAQFSQRAENKITAALPPRAKDAWTNIKDTFSKTAPWLLTTFQLAEQYGAKIKSLPALMKINDLMRVEATKQQMVFDAVAKKWDALSTDEGAKLDKVALRATLQEMHPDLPFGHKDNAHLKRTDPAENAAQMAKHAALAAQYNAMLPATKALYQEAKATLEASRTRMVEETKKLQDAYGVTKSIPDKTPGPYFPLMRFGEYLAIGESKAYQALADEVANASDAARPELTKKLNVMKRDPKHFVVSAHESRSEMETAQKTYAAQGLDARVSMANQRLGGLPRELHKMVQEMAQKMAGSFSGETANAVVDAYTEMLMKSLPELNALNRQAQRKGVEGASPDMKRAFAATGRQGAFYTSRLMYGRQAAASMLDMKTEVKGDIDLQHIHREMEKRAALNLVFQDTPIQNLMSQAGHMWYLAASPTYLLMNMTQPWLVTGPVLAGKYGLAASTKALARASREALAVLKDARWKDGKWSPWEGISENSIPGPSVSEDRKALRELIQRGIVVEGLTHEMELHASGSDGKFAKLARGMGWAAEQVEITNRIATALASFRLARAEKGSTYQSALDYAYATTVNTQMDYSQENTARFMRDGGGIPAAKLIFQFRRYQQAVLYLLGSNIKKLTNPAERKAAASTLAYFAVTSGLSAGVLGLPFMGVALAVANAFKDDDDEDGDAETVLRNALFDLTGDKAMATVLAKGLPAMFGADLSKRIGLGDVASPFPTLDLSGATGQDKVGRLAAAVAGPVLGGLGASAFDAASYFAGGDFVKGTEKLLPKVAADVLRAARLGTQGMTDRKGEQILGADEISAWDTVLRALGTTPVQQSNYYEGTRALKNTERAVEARKGRIQHEYVAALADGDMGDVRAKIDKFNEDHPTLAIKPKDETGWRKNARRSAGQRDETGIKFDPKRDGSYADTLRFAR